MFGRCVAPSLPLSGIAGRCVSASSMFGEPAWAVASAAVAKASRRMFSFTPAASEALRAGAGGVNYNPLANPVPELIVEEAKDLMVGRGGSNFPGALPVGVRLNEYERKAANAAKISGVLVMGAHCTASLCNNHLKYCYRRKRPYIAVSAHGDRIVVDMLPVAGVFSAVSADRMESAIKLFQQVVAAAKSKVPGGVQIVNASSYRDPGTIPQGDTLGSDEGKADDQEVSDQFSLLVSKKKHAFGLAESLWGAYCTEFGEVSPEDHATLRQARYEKRHSRWLDLMHRKIRRVVADKKLMKQRIPYGAFDGFIKADKEGRLEE